MDPELDAVTAQLHEWTEAALALVERLELDRYHYLHAALA